MSDTLSKAEQRELYRMVKEMYHHFGFDWSLPISANDIKSKAKRKVLQWQSKNEHKITTQ